MTTLNLALPILCLLASCIILFHFRNIIPAFKSYFWKKTTATISDFKIEITKYDQTCFFCGKIKFEYTINNKRYFGDKICFSNSLTSSCPDSSLGKYLQNAFQNKQSIEIFYNPLTPQNATIKNGLTTDMKVSLLGLIFFMSMGLFYIF